MAFRTRTCQRCQFEFSYQIARGMDRKYCDDECSTKALADSLRAKTSKLPECSVDGCSMAASRVGAAMCEKHYMRLRRTGQTDKVDRVMPGSLLHSGGYLVAHAPDHPLRRSSNRVYEHRIVYHAAHGDGPFSCHWCGVCVTWGDMHVDHLDAVVTNNSVGNLVASCPTCNQKRGLDEMRATSRAKAKQYTAHGKTMCMSEWSRTLGISRASIKWRLSNGWNAEDAFTPRRGNSGPQRQPSQRREPDLIG